VLGALALLATGAVHSATTTTTTTFAVTTTVQSTCSATATALAFGAYTPGTGALTNASTITVKCTKTTPYSVALNAGANGTLAQRLMASGTNRLQYNLYSTTAYGTILGDGTGGTLLSTGVGAGLATGNVLNVYGQLPDNATNQVAVPGSYSDTITVTVTY
jgi:spore coat protein U-like protein